MSQNATIEVVSSSVKGGSSDNEGPAKLMRSGDPTNLDTADYPHVTAYVNVDSASGTIRGLEEETFEVHEDGDEREILSLDFIDDALDLVFVFDDTGSMSAEIDGAKAGVTELTDSIDARDINARYAIVSFKDDVEVDQSFTSRASHLKSSVDQLSASSGGDVPEANFDAIERALDLNWRKNAQRVIVDITDAPSHYRGDGSGFSDYTFDEVTQHLRETEVTFISVGPDQENQTDSLKSVAGAVGGLWTDIRRVRTASGNDAPDNFQRVLERISSLIASTYVLTYFSCAPPGKQTPVKITLDHPDYRRVSDTARVNVPGKYDLHPDCSSIGDATKYSEKSTDDTPSVTKLNEDDTKDSEPKVTKLDPPSEVIDIALLPEQTEVKRGQALTVTVRDEDGSCLEDVTVEAPNSTGTTDSRGTCRITLTETPEATLTATKEGTMYGSDSVTINVQDQW
jgi:Mg-chelatase subunit ChlD/uncharacterized protein YceK